MNDYDRVSRSIEYLINNADSPPALDELINQARLSPCHFQCLFKRWAGVSAERFLHSLTVKHTKKILNESKPALAVGNDSGLSTSEYPSGHLVSIKPVTPGKDEPHEYGFNIDYGIHETPFGYALIALTEHGICRLAFIDDNKKKAAIKDLEQSWPAAGLVKNSQKTGAVVKMLFEKKSLPGNPLTLYMKGSNFQITVWRALLTISGGRLFTYGQVARMIGKPNAPRAVGSAIASNPVGFIIPCHRVIKSSGVIGDYRWGNIRKRAIIGWETCTRQIS